MSFSVKCLKSLRTPTLKNICERMRFSCKRRFMNCSNSSRKKIKCMRYRIRFINDSFLLASEAHEVLLCLRMKPGWKYLGKLHFSWIAKSNDFMKKSQRRKSNKPSLFFFRDQNLFTWSSSFMLWWMQWYSISPVHQRRYLHPSSGL